MLLFVIIIEILDWTDAPRRVKSVLFITISCYTKGLILLVHCRSAGRQVGKSAGRLVGRSAGRQVGRYSIKGKIFTFPKWVFCTLLWRSKCHVTQFLDIVDPFSLT